MRTNGYAQPGRHHDQRIDGCSAGVSMTGRRLWAGVMFAVLVGAVSSMLGVAPAGAHAAYKYSSPDDESTVSQAPVEIWAEYTEPPSEASYLRVYSPCGDQVDNGDSRPEAYRVYITMSGETAGNYRAEWFVDSELDNHPTRGTFTFTVTNGEPCPGAEQPKEKEPRKRNGNGSGSDQPAQPRMSTDNGDDAGTEAGSGPSNGARNKARGPHNKHRKQQDREKGKDRGEKAQEGDLAAADDPSPGDEAGAEEPGLLSDIPIGGLVIALGMAAAIGAAGGFIYAGIMGYHRVSN